MNTISIISAIAVVVSIGGIFPQIVAMFQARSSAGQSAVGWCLGVLVNGLLGYVNLVGLHSTMLAAGNAVGLILSGTALALVFRYRPVAAPETATGGHAGTAVATLLDSAQAPLANLETSELEALQGAVTDARETRRRRREPVLAGGCTADGGPCVRRGGQTAEAPASQPA